MPLDVDQYNVRRYHRNGYLSITEDKAKRDPQTGALIGKVSEEKFRFRYSQASLTSDDTKILSSVIERISKKVEIPYDYKFDHTDHAPQSVVIDNVKYNLEKVDTTYNSRMFLYLSTVSTNREVNNA